MYLAQHLKTKLYAVFLRRNGEFYCQWHSRREYATRADSKDSLEDMISESGADRDKMRIVYDDFK